MKTNQLSDQEKKTYDWLISKTQPEISKYQRGVVVISAIVFLAIVVGVINYWINPTVSHSTSLLIGGQLCTLYGGLLLAMGAFSSPSTLALLSMTRWNGNPSLFASLVKVRFAAMVGVCFVVGGFAIQGATMVTFST